MPFAAQNQGKRFKNKVVFQSRPYAYESMLSYYSGVEKVCPWNPDFPYIHWRVFCKTLKLHNGRRAESCCQSYKWSRLSHEPLTPWLWCCRWEPWGCRQAVGTAGVAAPLARWGSAGVPLRAGCRCCPSFDISSWAVPHFFFIFAQSAAHFLKQECLSGDGIDCCGGSCGCLLTQNAQESGGIGPDLSTPELVIWKPARPLELTAVFFRGILYGLCLTERKSDVLPLVLRFISQFVETNMPSYKETCFNRSRYPILSASSWMALKGLWEGGKDVWFFMVVFFLSLLFFVLTSFCWNDSKACILL